MAKDRRWQAQAAPTRIAWLPTLVAKGPQTLRPEHLRRHPEARRTARLHLIVLDTSGSMRQAGRLALAKGYAARLIERAARAGEQVALLSFGGRGVELLLPPRPARATASTRVRRLGGGGGTPLAQCLIEAERLLCRVKRREPTTGTDTWLWLLTDGRTLERPAAPAAAGHVVIVDFDQSPKAIGRCAAWAQHWRAEYRNPTQPDSLHHAS
jgi:magnesium chelatase subunit ChlD-like protein